MECTVLPLSLNLPTILKVPSGIFDFEKARYSTDLPTGGGKLTNIEQCEENEAEKKTDRK